MSPQVTTPASVAVLTDASGSWGCGAVWETSWFKVPWSADWSDVNCEYCCKRTSPVVLAFWAEKHVLVRTDNMAVTNIHVSLRPEAVGRN